MRDPAETVAGHSGRVSAGVWGGQRHLARRLGRPVCAPVREAEVCGRGRDRGGVCLRSPWEAGTAGLECASWMGGDGVGVGGRSGARRLAGAARGEGWGVGPGERKPEARGVGEGPGGGGAGPGCEWGRATGAGAVAGMEAGGPGAGLGKHRERATPRLGAVATGRGIPPPRRPQPPVIGRTGHVPGVVLGLRFREAKGTKATQDLFTNEDLAGGGGVLAG